MEDAETKKGRRDFLQGAAGVPIAAQTPFRLKTGVASSWAQLPQELLSGPLAALLPKSSCGPARLACKAWATGVAHGARRLAPTRRCPPGWGSTFRGAAHLHWTRLASAASPLRGQVAEVSRLGNLRALRLEGAADEDVACLARLGGLRSLDLSNSDVTDTGLALLRRLPSLTTLNLAKLRRITDEGLCALAPLSRLASLDLSNVYAVSDRVLAACCSRMHALTHLNLSHSSGITDAGLAAIGRLPDLAYLNLQCCRLVTDEGLACVAQQMPRLAYLNLWSCHRITPAGLMALQRLGGLRSLILNCLGFAPNAIRGSAADRPSLLPLALTSLSLNNIDDAGLCALVRPLASSLRSLSLRICCKLSDEGLEALEGLASLTSLDLTGLRKLSPHGLRCLQPLSSLRHLNLSRCSLADDGVAALGALTALTSLSFSLNPNLTDAALAHLQPLQCLSHLDAGACRGLTDCGLASLRPLTALVSLGLSSSGITDAGLAKLDSWAAHSSSALKFVELYHCRFITQDAVAAVSNIAVNTKLSLSPTTPILRGGFALDDRHWDDA